MAKTFNRRPLQVNTPSSNDVKNYFFNHYNWKGLCTDKNFLAVDQETFADAKNVYVDAEGLLKSRPSVKRKKMLFDSAIDFWNFDDVNVSLCTTEKYGNYLVAEKNGVKVTTEYNLLYRDLKLTRLGNIIYIFSKHHFLYFDVEEMKFGDGFEKTYVPTTVFDSVGVKTKDEKSNILTDKEKHIYQYSRELGISNEVYGKELKVKINGSEYNLVFDQYTPELLTDVLLKVPDFYDGVVMSNNNTFLFYSKERKLISYSATGDIISKNFTLPEGFGEIIGKPKFSRDSNYGIVCTTESIYIVSLVADSSSGEMRYEEFTSVIPEDYWPSKSFNITEFDCDFTTYDDFSCIVCYDIPAGSDASNYYLYRYFEGEFNKHILTGIKTNPRIFNTSFEKDTFGDSYILGGNNLNGQFVLYMYVPNFIETQYEPLLVLVDGINSSYLSDLKTFNNEIVYIERTDFGDNYLKKIYMQDGNLKLKSLLYRENDFNNHLLSLDVSKIFTGNGIYYVNTDIYRGLVINDTQNNPIFYGDDVYYLDDENNLFSSALRNDLEFNYFKDGDNHLLDVDVISRLDNLYFSSGETLYISDYREENGEFRLYLPNDYKKTFDSSITGLHPISLSEMGVFLQDSIWYVQRMDDIYYATKSKLELGIKFGSDIITSYDGSRIVFPTERGIVTLSYQDFVASTDQVLTFLSDAIHLQMREFCKQPVKLFKNDYWIIVYRQDSNEFYILDSRNNSWWFWSIPVNVKKLLKYDDNSLLLSNDNNFYRFDESNENYFDYDGKRKQIDWHLESQKLHLSQINNYKHIVNMTFNSVIDTQPYLTFFLDVKNYRKQIDEGKTENLSYSVENLRTYVQRLNYFKVNEFQYKLYSDNQDRYPLPLSLSSISIKYKMQGQVR